jgi:hypothetical protein
MVEVQFRPLTMKSNIISVLKDFYATAGPSYCLINASSYSLTGVTKIFTTSNFRLVVTRNSNSNGQLTKVCIQNLHVVKDDQQAPSTELRTNRASSYRFLDTYPYNAFIWNRHVLRGKLEVLRTVSGHRLSALGSPKPIKLVHGRLFRSLPHPGSSAIISGTRVPSATHISTPKPELDQK